jgi:C-22 sterol desaturase
LARLEYLVTLADNVCSPHYCLGQHYAMLNLAMMIGKASMELDWTHHPTPLSEDIKVFATIFPEDDCPLVFTKRPEQKI